MKPVAALLVLGLVSAANAQFSVAATTQFGPGPFDVFGGPVFGADPFGPFGSLPFGSVPFGSVPVGGSSVIPWGLSSLPSDGLLSTRRLRPRFGGLPVAAGGFNSLRLLPNFAF